MPRSRKKPRIETDIHVRLTEDMRRWVEARAARNRRSMANEIRCLLDAAAEREHADA